MVALDDRTRDAERLDDIRVDRTLTEPLDIGELVRLLIEDLDEAPTDDLTLLLGIGDALECREELLPSIHTDDIEPKVFVVTEDILILVLTQ